VSGTEGTLSLAPPEQASVEYLIVVRGVLCFSFHRPRRSSATRFRRAARARLASAS
jgi:hypothetical protein